jgi:hypothetical protein
MEPKRKRHGSSRALALTSTTLALLSLLLILSSVACSRRQVAGRLEQAQVVTQQTLFNALLGEDPNERFAPIRDTRYADKPLLEKGIYENVYLLVDVEEFVKISRGSVDKGEVEAVQKNIITSLKKPLEKRGFSIVNNTNTPKTLKIWLTPTLQESVAKPTSPQEKKTPLILVKMVISDAQTGDILTERSYYSGQDVKR